MKVLKLRHAIPVVPKSYEEFKSADLKLSDLRIVTKDIENKLSSATEIVYPKSDDVRTTVSKSGDKIISSCDAGRGYIIHKDNTIDLVNPYEVWDSWIECPHSSKPFVDQCTIYASGYIKNKRAYLDMIYVYDEEDRKSFGIKKLPTTEELLKSAGHDPKDFMYIDFETLDKDLGLC